MSSNFDNDSDASINGNNLGTAVDQDSLEDNEVIGRAYWSTTGEVIVPQEWLKEQFRKYDLPMYLLPSEPSPWSAYRRTLSYLIQPGYADTFTVDGHDVEVEMRDDEDHANRNFIEAHEFIPASERMDDEGRWKKTDIGMIDYNKEQQAPMFENREGGYRFSNVWATIVKRCRDLSDELGESYIDADMRNNLLYEAQGSNNSIKLRDGGAVYFVPNMYAGRMEKLSKVWSAMNTSDEVRKVGQHGGNEVRITTMPVFDTADKMELVERQVKKRLRSDVDEALEKAFNRLSGDTDETAGEIVEHVADQLEQASGIEADYNALLQSRLSVEEMLKDELRNLSDVEKRDVVEEAIGEVN
jgi:hypothetical protein